MVCQLNPFTASSFMYIVALSPDEPNRKKETYRDERQGKHLSDLKVALKGWEQL